MSDIPQWRLKIPPSRSRTPMLESPEIDQGMRPPSALAGPSTRPPTPKRGLRPKLSSYLSQSAPFGAASKEPEPFFADHLTPSFPSWAVEDTFPNTSAEQLIHAVMCRLMARPYESLESRFNGSLLQIFEAYRQLADERDRLEKRLAEEVDGRSADRSAMQKAERRWEDEKETYKAEVKRLELVIAKGKRGVAEVALVRQDSLIRGRKMMAGNHDDEDDGKETVFEFLEKTKMFEPKDWSGQRATMKLRPASPSAKMARLSKRLAKKTSKTSIHAELPFGSPPPNIPSTSLLQASYLEDQAKLEKTKVEDRPQAAAEARVSFSDDTASTFSCAGDFLPDETGERLPLSSISEPLPDSDILELRQMAATISRRRDVNIESVMPRLVEMFRSPSSPEEPSSQRYERTLGQRMMTAPVANATSAPPARKSSHIKGFFNKLRTQASLDTVSDTRRFSFEFGDDAEPIRTAYETTSRDSPLRKSASLSSLPTVTHHVTNPTAPVCLSPIESSPATSVRTTDSRRTSKIPSPSYNAALAKPRQERDGSVSSLGTVMREADKSAPRTASAGSSVYSAHSSLHYAADEAISVPRVAPSRASERSSNRSELERLRGNVGISSDGAAGSLQARHLPDHTDTVTASNPRCAGNVPVKGCGSVSGLTANATPGQRVPSPTRGGSDGRSGLVYDAGLRPLATMLENSRPLLHSPRSDGADINNIRNPPGRGD
ncbi:hypothetical protein WHR41_07830 [Cladosporium halotolerans]|uniref:Uncharacterized protein n=1 Tax=Cladosporium halotolerans TaxID=1052096 RepID=A0AB34KDS7_9PEZI